MGKAGRWLRSFLPGKKDRDKPESKQPPPPPPAPAAAGAREKRRWSFRRPAAAAWKEPGCPGQLASMSAHGFFEAGADPGRHAGAVAVARAAAADAAAAKAAAAAIVRLTAAGGRASKRSVGIEDAAAIKIQSVFRSHLARKALCALRGLVKLQALVRGHLVRRQASNTLRCMQALLAAQARARAERMRLLLEEEEDKAAAAAYWSTPRRHHRPPHRRSPQHPRFRQPPEATDRNSEENVRIVEVDTGDVRGTPKCGGGHSCYATPQSRTPASSSKALDLYNKVSPTPSALIDEGFSFATAQSSPRRRAPSTPSCTSAAAAAAAARPAHDDYPQFPSYMANTESSRAKARSQSAPRQRPAAAADGAYERQPSRRRASLEAQVRSMIPRGGGRMLRSSSQAGASPYPVAVKLDMSYASLNESECGSTSTVLTGATYWTAMH